MPTTAGRFITFEGADGCGKSTQTARFVDALKREGIEVLHLREPGGTKTSEAIRELLLNPASTVSPLCELLLFEASRAQLVTEVIEPALKRGTWVVCDRFFDSTSAYQRSGRNLDASLVEEANKIGSNGLVPDVTFIFDLPVVEALRRATHGGSDRMEGEGEAFQENVRQGFLQIARENPNRCEVVDASGSKEEVFSRVLKAAAQHGITLLEDQ